MESIFGAIVIVFPKDLIKRRYSSPFSAAVPLLQVGITCLVIPIGVLFGCFARNIDGDSWFTW